MASVAAIILIVCALLISECLQMPIEVAQGDIVVFDSGHKLLDIATELNERAQEEDENVFDLFFNWLKIPVVGVLCVDDEKMGRQTAGPTTFANFENLRKNLCGGIKEAKSSEEAIGNVLMPLFACDKFGTTRAVFDDIQKMIPKLPSLDGTNQFLGEKMVDEFLGIMKMLSPAKNQAANKQLTVCPTKQQNGEAANGISSSRRRRKRMDVVLDVLCGGGNTTNTTTTYSPHHQHHGGSSSSYGATHHGTHHGASSYGHYHHHHHGVAATSNDPNSTVADVAAEGCLAALFCCCCYRSRAQHGGGPTSGGTSSENANGCCNTKAKRVFWWVIIGLVAFFLALVGIVKAAGGHFIL